MQWRASEAGWGWGGSPRTANLMWGKGERGPQRAWLREVGAVGLRSGACTRGGSWDPSMGVVGSGCMAALEGDGVLGSKEAKGTGLVCMKHVCGISGADAGCVG